MARVLTLLVAIWLGLTVSARAESYLLMAEEVGCMWCARWNNEIGDIYPKTQEGRAAPLRRYDIHVGAPDGIELASPVRFTPTFLLIHDGAEAGRIEGYPGEDFFWGLLGRLFERARIETSGSG